MVLIIISFTAKVLDHLTVAIPQTFIDMSNYKRNFDDLKKEAENLKLTIDGLQHKIYVAKENGEQLEQSVEKWLTSANLIIAEAGKLTEDEEKAKKQCFMGLCPNLINRYQLSKKAARKVKAIGGLQKEGKFDKVSVCNKPEGTSPIYSEGYVAFESRKSILNDTLDALRNPNVNMIGLCGMGGIGKTTLAKRVFDQAKEQKLCDEVVFVEVSQSPDVKRIQGEIAGQLGLNFFQASESERAMMLSGRLKKGKNILVVLDNIWTSLDLEKVGIPLGGDYKGCKILLTSRNQDVLASDMHCQNNYRLSILNREEASSLFTKVVGDCFDDHELQSIASQIVIECGGLPLAIVIVARALRNKSLAEWNDALQELRSSAEKFKGSDALVYSSIELSYNYLIDQDVKSTFLLCGLLKHSCDAHIMDLLKYGTCFDIFKGTHTMQERRDRLHASVLKLKDYCLLLDGPTKDWICMHDLVNEVAISIASRDSKVFMVKNDVQIEWPSEVVLKNCPAIFFLDCKPGKLPEGLECPQIEFFCMNPADSFIEIPDHFFTGMSKLRGLALSKMQFSSLPSSFHLLSNLQTLCLNQCVLGDAAIIGNLKKLEILSFVNSDIEQLPNEIGQLTHLKLLDLSDCLKLEVIPPNLISRLSQLEELYMGNTSVKWEFEGHNVERSNASLHELKQLSHLTILEIHIHEAMILPKGLFSKKLERYRIFIGDEWDWSGKYENKRELKLKLYSSIYMDEVIMQLKGMEELYLDEVPGIKNVLYDLDKEGFPRLKLLQVQNNPFILYIVDSKALVHCNAFPCLDSLFLHNLIHLEKICHGPLTADYFCKLSILKVRNCDKLKNIFSFSIVRGLPQIRTLNVIKCKNMKEIFTVGRENDVAFSEVDKIEFSQLRFLTLKFLPRLFTFYSQVKTSATSQNILNEMTTHKWPSKDILEDERDTLMPNERDNFMPLFSEKVVLPNLETLEICSIRIEKIWCNQITAVCLQNLTRLIVHGCEKLKYLFPSSIVRNFVQLEHLEVCYCTALEKIVGKERGEEAIATFVFPKVTFMKLWNLSELKTFYPGVHTSGWPMLKRLEVYGCDKIKIFTSEFPSFHESSEEEVHFDILTQQALFLVEKVSSNLEELKLSGKDISMICQDQFPEHLFRKLIILEVVNDKSENFPIGFLQRFHNIEKLELRCSAYKEIFSNGEVEKHSKMLTQIKSLKLWELFDLMCLWKKDSNLDIVAQNLEILEVWWCENLISLVPSSASFKNLTTLEVWYCHGLMNLVTSSTAKSFVCLMKLRIDCCKMLTEVISKEEGVVEDEIVFSKLKWVSLERLENLTSFCSDNCTLKFPSLEDLFVIDCPKMEIFSSGDVCSPRLLEVQLNWGLHKGRWDCDLNTTIWQLHKNKLTLLPPIASSSFSVAAPTTASHHSSNPSSCRKTQQKTVLKLEISDEKAQQKAFNIVSKFTGVISISFDMKEKKMTVIGDIDAVTVVKKLRKQLCFTELVSVGPANEPEDEEREGNNEESENADVKME